jgi:hypothetical protein
MASRAWRQRRREIRKRQKILSCPMNNIILQKNNHIFTMSTTRLASPIPVSFPAAHRRRLSALARRHGVSAAAIVRAGVDLALPELERPRQPASASAIQPAGAGTAAAAFDRPLCLATSSVAAVASSIP